MIRRLSYTMDINRRSDGGSITLHVDNMSRWHPALTPLQLPEFLKAVNEEFEDELAEGVMGLQGITIEGFEAFDYCTFFVRRGTVRRRLFDLLMRFDIQHKRSGIKIDWKDWSAWKDYTGRPKIYLTLEQLQQKALQAARDKERDARNKAAYEATTAKWAASSKARREAKKEFIGPPQRHEVVKSKPIEYPPNANWQDKFVVHMGLVGRALAEEKAEKEAAEKEAAKKPAEAG